MNDQEFFTKAVQHCLRQNRVARTEHGACAYRTTDEHGVVVKCAVGGVLPDEVLDELTTFGLLNRGIRYSMGQSPKMHAALSGVTPALMTDVQEVHDEYRPTLWVDMFTEVAKTYNLEMPQ